MIFGGYSSVEKFALLDEEYRMIKDIESLEEINQLRKSPKVKVVLKYIEQYSTLYLFTRSKPYISNKEIILYKENKRISLSPSYFKFLKRSKLSPENVFNILDSKINDENSKHFTVSSLQYLKWTIIWSLVLILIVWLPFITSDFKTNPPKYLPLNSELVQKRIFITLITTLLTISLAFLIQIFIKDKIKKDLNL